MTTKLIVTPYDAEIEAWTGPTQHGHNFGHLMALQEGYLKAIADMQPRHDSLVAALRGLCKTPFSPQCCAWCGKRHSVPHAADCPTIQVEAALKAEKEE